MAKMSKSAAMPKGMPPKGMPSKGMHMMGGKMMSDVEMQKMHGSPPAKKGKK